MIELKNKEYNKERAFFYNNDECFKEFLEKTIAMYEPVDIDNLKGYVRYNKLKLMLQKLNKDKNDKRQ